MALLFSVSLIALLALLFTLHRDKSTSPATGNQQVEIIDGVQIIYLTAKGGYSPRHIEAIAGMPAELRVATQGTFDCSSSLIIPALDYQKMLSPTGVETIRIDADTARGTLEGMCGMGMYSFDIAFK